MEGVTNALNEINETLQLIRQDLNENKQLKSELIKVTEEMQKEIIGSPFYGSRKQNLQFGRRTEDESIR
ncbi:hypothetical protein [Hutsoniella sourekii]|uniref:hypothetical protein n=1 Tax=Hutsoniella sourekii TaxID=87650 RepID=UPI000488B94A|nr:hypothetical protein [Hutsoniella sourekii]